MNLSILLVSTLALAGTPDQALDGWSSFRNGGSSQSASVNLPLSWSPDRGIAWQHELPGYGQSAPVVWEGVVYLTAVDGPLKQRCLLLALDGRTGDEQWHIEGPASTGLPSNYHVSRAAPTPAVDDRGVYAFYEGGDVIAARHDGVLAWRRSLTKDYGEFNNHHGLGSSPAQSDDALFINVEHRGPSYLVCLDKATGHTRWKTARKSSMSWSSPLVVKHGARQLVVVSSGGAADAYDAASGDTVWSLSDVSGNSIPSPTAHGDCVFLSAALSDFDTATNAARSNLCLRLTDGGRFDLVWRAERAMCDYASPVCCCNCVYYVSRAGVLYSLDQGTGREHYARRIPSPCWATPIAAGNRLYLFGKDGMTTVVQGGPQYVELGRNLLWDPAHPPQPETYTMTPGGHGHHAEEGAQSSPGKAGGGGFAAMLLRNDKNGDGRIAADELADDQQRLLAAGDKNGDRQLDESELAQMGEEFRKRRENSAQESRDPLVYGVAAANGSLFLRTGTRLYCVRAD